MSDIDKEIENLQKLLAEKLKEKNKIIEEEKKEPDKKKKKKKELNEEEKKEKKDKKIKKIKEHAEKRKNKVEVKTKNIADVELEHDFVIDEAIVGKFKTYKFYSNINYEMTMDHLRNKTKRTIKDVYKLFEFKNDFNKIIK